MIDGPVWMTAPREHAICLSGNRDLFALRSRYP